MTFNQPPVQYKTESLKDEWKKFCRKLYASVLEIEKVAEQEFMQARKNDIIYTERRKKIQQCEKYKKLITESAEKKQFTLDDQDMEIILEKGFDYYFKFYQRI